MVFQKCSIRIKKPVKETQLKKLAAVKKGEPKQVAGVVCNRSTHLYHNQMLDKHRKQQKQWYENTINLKKINFINHLK